MQPNPRITVEIEDTTAAVEYARLYFSSARIFQ